MNKAEMELVEKIMEGNHVGYAYLYPSDGSPREEYVFDMTSENIANFIGKHPYDADKIILTDMFDSLILDTFGNFINNCPNQELLKEIKADLVPIQMGEREAEDFPMVKRDILNEYIQMEEEAVMQAEMEMM